MTYSSLLILSRILLTAIILGLGRYREAFSKALSPMCLHRIVSRVYLAFLAPRHPVPLAHLLEWGWGQALLSPAEKSCVWFKILIIESDLLKKIF